MEMKEKGDEEVNEYKYLGYILQTNRRQEIHIKERVKKAFIVMGQM